MEPLLRFMDKITLAPGPLASQCWLWGGAINKVTGYGVFGHSYTTSNAHKFAHTNLVGAPVPHPLVLDHLCQVKHCVNPDHLQVATRRINFQRGKGNAMYGRDHCAAGHKYTAANTVWKGNARRCRACGNRRNREYRARLSGKQLER